MKRLLTLLSLALLLAAPVTLTTGCKTPVLKSFQSDTTITANVKSAMATWFTFVVADKLTADQEIHMRDLTGKYLTTQMAYQALIQGGTTDKVTLVNAISIVQATADDVINYVHTTTGK